MVMPSASFSLGSLDIFIRNSLLILVEPAGQTQTPAPSAVARCSVLQKKDLIRLLCTLEAVPKTNSDHQPQLEH
jgi:hypothetical protein